MSEMKKRFGQNFLKDANLLDAIVRDAGVEKDDEVLEIGAGAGALTKALNKTAKHIVSYEIDRDLKDGLLNLNLNNVEFVFCDILKEDMAEIEKRFDGEYKLVANLPYYITTPIIFKFLEEAKKLTSMTIMVQKEVAQRLVAKQGKEYGILSVMIAFYGEAKIMRTVGRKMFYPVPNVDSAIVRIDIDPKKFKGIDRQKFSALVKSAFAMRRKTLGNNLLKVFDKSILNIDEKLLNCRAENLSVEEFINLYKAIYKNQQK